MMTSRNCHWAFALGMTLALCGCPKDDESALVSCDPLASGGRPLVKLEGLIAIGKADTGVLYVVDQPDDSDFRLFVSEGHSLVRHDIRGSGAESGGGALKRIGLLVTGAAPFRLLIELDGDRRRMMLVEGDASSDRNLDIATAGGHELAVEPKSAIEGLRVLDLPQTVYVEYSARVEGDRRLVVLRPQYDFRGDDFRVFFGPEDGVEERNLIRVVRTRDGGSTHVVFEVASEQADAFFPNRIQADGGTIQEPVTFALGSKQLEIERLPREQPELDGLEFRCAR